MKKVDLKFIIFHRKTKTEIIMPVLSICEEYSSISFNTKDDDYDGKYSGIGRLPSYPYSYSEKDYDFYVLINDKKYLYDGLFLNKDYTETKRK